MNWRRKFGRRWRALFAKEQLDAEMEAEMRSHLEMQTQENIEGGMKPEEARQAALRQFGWMESIKENCREQRGVWRIENLMRDFRHAVRSAAKNPLFTMVSVGVLAIGLGGTTTVFSLFDGLFLRPFPVPHQERLVDLNETDPQGGGYLGVPYDHFDAWREHNLTFEVMAFCSFWSSNLAGQGNSERARILLATHDLFPLLGIRPVIGRPFTAAEDRPGGPNVILLSYRVWERMFEKSPEILGRTVRLDNDPFTVIGVLPPEACFPVENEVWRPLAAQTGKAHPGMGSLVLGRLKPGVTPRQASADLAWIEVSAAEQNGYRHEPTVPVVTGFRERYLRDYQFGVRVLGGVVGFVLLIACCNVTSILLARGATRTKEVAMRLALGATRGRIIQYLLGESLVLSVFGTVFGVLLGCWAVHAIVASLAHVIPPWMSFRMDLRFACFSALLAALVSGLSGLLPSLQAVRGVNLHESLGALGGGATETRSRLRLLNVIVVGQIALALMLVIGAGLFLRSLHRVQAVDPGFRPAGLLTYQIPLPIGPYLDAQKRQLFFEQHLEKVRSLPGVQDATICNSLPCCFLNTASFEVEGARERGRSGSEFAASKCSVMAGYFDTMGVRLVSGRVFSSWDNGRAAAKCVVIDEACARRFWPNAGALGKRLRPTGSEHWLEVIGVVHDIKNVGLDQLTWPTVYVPYGSDPSFVTSGVVRSSGDPTALVSAIREILRSADPEVPLVDVQTMSERMRKTLWGGRILAWVVGVSAAAAGLMASAGIFGVISYGVSQRIREFGIRLALGAPPRHLMGLVLRAGIARVGLGLVLGLGLGLGLTRVVQGLLFGIAPTDPLTFILATLLLVTVSAAAFWLPMRRAASLDPIVVLRSE